ncbi:MAG: ABC transporter permease [Gemmatimonadota bacterium]
MTPTRRRYLRFWKNVPAEVDDELRFHLESSIQDNIAAGMSPDAARATALARFGNVERVRELCESIDQQLERERRRASMWGSMMGDLRYALRALRRNPGFTAVAVLTLALGIGANTAIFSVVNGVLLRPLPYREPEQLVRLFTAFRVSGESRYSMSQPEFMDYKGLTHVFENAAAYNETGLTLTGNGEPERVRGIMATRDLLPVLGINPARGRNFQGDEGRQGTEPVVILSHEYWRNRFGGDSAMLGKSLSLNGINRRLIGILPAGETFARADAFIPRYINPDSLSGRSSNSLSGVARLRPGVSVDQAQRELDALTKRSEQQYPGAYPATMGYGATVVAMHEEIVGDIKPALLILLGAVGLVLLIACANVANLLLARGEARQREVAVRLALGAGRGRIIRQLLTESTVLAMLGATVGTLLAWWATKSLIAISPDTIPRVGEVRIDLTVGLVTLAVAVITGMLFGLAPALQLTRTDLQSSLKEGTRGGTESGRHSIGRLLVIGELALAVVVVIGAALLVRSFNTLRGVDPGFNPDGLLVIDMAIPVARYDVAATTAFYQTLVSRLRALPGARSVAAASDVPPVAGGSNWDIAIDGRTRGPDETAPSPNVRFVTHDYFSTMAIPLARGRLFTEQDRGTSPPVAIINEATAKAVWPGADPVGQRVRFSDEQPWVTIIGVSRDTRSNGLGDPVPSELFILHEQLPAVAGGSARTMFVVVRTSSAPTALASAARATIRELDPGLAISAIRSMDEIMATSVARQRFSATLLGGFGVVALTLAAIGIYGIMAYGVKRRTREIGIRMALGATPSNVLRLVVSQGMRLAGVGLVTGVASALFLTQLMDGLLFGIRATDPLTYVVVAVTLATVAFAATWIPARRAVRTDPSTALRMD